MKDEMMMSQSLFSRSSKMKRLRLISVAAVLLAVCLVFVGAAGADAVAKIDGKEGEFDSIQEAVEKAESGDKILVTESHNLLEDYDQLQKVIVTKDSKEVIYNVLVHVTTGKDITIDLNGKIVTVDYDSGDNWNSYQDVITAVIWVDNNAKLILTDSSEDKTGTLKVIATESNAMAEQDSKGKWHASNHRVRYMLFNYNEDNHATEGGHKLVIDGGIYEFDYGIIDTDSPGSMVYSQNSKTTLVTGGKFKMGNTGKGPNASPWIFNAQGQNTNNIIVEGGTFNADIVHQYYPFEVSVPKEKALVENPTGIWTIVDDAVAYVNEQEWSSAWYTNEVGYATLQEALYAVEGVRTRSGETSPEEKVTLLDDCTAAETLKIIDKDVVINLDGHTIFWKGDDNDPIFTIFKVSCTDEIDLTIDEFTPIREGYTFDGWYTDSEFTNELTDKDGVLTVGTSLYAKWTPNSYTITVIQSNGGEVDASKYEAHYNNEIELTQKPDTGYEFKEWEVTADNGDNVPVTDDKFIMPADNVTVTATFNPCEYKVTFDANGGSVTTENIPVTYNSPYGTLPLPTRDGYEFVGWYLNGELINENTKVTVTNDHILTAEWKEITTPPTSSGGSGISGYESHSRTTKNGGSVDFGASKVVKGVILPEGSSGSVVLKVDTIEGWTNILETEYTFDISVQTMGDGMAYILFEIPLRTLENLGITPADVCAYHFIDGEWVMLKTNYEVKEGTVFYEAETDSFSPFKLVFEEGAATPKEAETEPVIPPTEEPENKPEDIAPPLDEPVQPTEPETPAPILAVLAGLGAAVVLRRK